MSDYDERPGSARYATDQPADIDDRVRQRAGDVPGRLAADPDGDIGPLLRRAAHPRGARPAERRVRRRAARRTGSRPATGWRVYLQNVPQFVIALLGAWKAGGVDGLDQPDEPGPRADLPAEGLGRHGAGLRWRRCTRRRARRGPDTDVRARAHHLASWSTRPATTSGCSRASSAAPRGHRSTSRAARAARAGRPRPPVELGRDDVAFLTYTSGTTGVPKGAMNTHRNVVFNARSTATGSSSARDGSVLGVAPLFHITGLIGHIAVALLVAGAAGAGLPVRAGGGARRHPRAPADVHRRRDHRLHRADERAGRATKDALRLPDQGLLRRRADPADAR